jgi:DNA polymerase-1
MCQGTSADLMKKAMVKIWLWLRENDMKSKIIMTIHDEIVLEVLYAEERIVIPKVKEFMEDLKSFFVPITIDTKVVTKRWSHKSSLKDLGLEWAA